MVTPGPYPSPSPVPTAAPCALLTVPGGSSGTVVLQELAGATCPPPGRSPQPLPTAAGQGEHPSAKQTHSLWFHLPASHPGSPLLHRWQPMGQDRDSLPDSQTCPVQQDRTWPLDHEARLKAYLCLKGVGFGVDANRPEGKEKQKQRYVLSSPHVTGAEHCPPLTLSLLTWAMGRGLERSPPAPWASCPGLGY